MVRSKDVDDQDKIVECQVEYVEDEVANGRFRNDIGPRGSYFDNTDFTTNDGNSKLMGTKEWFCLLAHEVPMP